MKKTLLRVSILLVAITAVSLGAFSFFANTSGSGTSVSAHRTSSGERLAGGWRVWIRTSPCSGRFDWLAVAKDNKPPEGGGLSSYVPYETLLEAPPGIKACRDANPMTGCTFDEANVLMEALRPSDVFLDYCCRDYSVWEDTRSTEIDNMSVFLIRSGTPGLGWALVQGELCCDEAEKMAKKPGACSGSGNKNGKHFGPINEGAGLNGKTLTFYAGTTAEKCQADCDQNPQCKGFSLIRPGAYGSNGAMCYLMSEATSYAPSPCCISGIKIENEGAVAATPTPTRTPGENSYLGYWLGTMRIGGKEERVTIVFKTGSNGKLEVRFALYSNEKTYNVEVNGNVITWMEDAGYGLIVSRFTIDPGGRTASGTYTVTKNSGATVTGYYVDFKWTHGN
jgi:hypothetical protein